MPGAGGHLESIVEFRCTPQSDDSDSRYPAVNGKGADSIHDGGPRDAKEKAESEKEDEIVWVHMRGIGLFCP